MTSRFFATGDTSEEESSSSSGELSDAVDVVPRAGSGPARVTGATGAVSSTVGGGFSRARFLMDEDESDSDSDGRRVVKSKETKKYEALVHSLRQLRNHLKINDWTSVQQDFDELNRRLERALSTDVARGGRPPVPRPYVKALVLLEDEIAKTLAEKPKLSKTNTKALNTTRQRLRKNNREYEEAINEYRASGADPWESSEAGASSSDESETPELETLEPEVLDRKRRSGKASFVGSRPAGTARGTSEASSSSAGTASDTDSESKSDASSSWATSSSDEDESSSEESSESLAAEEPAEAVRGARAARWLRRESSASSSSSSSLSLSRSDESSDDSSVSGRRGRQERRARAVRRKSRADEDADGFIRKYASPAREEKPEDLTAEQLEERIVQLVAARGRKGTDRREQVRQMEWLSRAAKTPAQLVRVLLHMIAAQFDLGHTLGVMPRDMYQAAANTAERLLQIAKSHPKVVRSAIRDLGAASGALGSTEAETLEYVMVDFAALVERLDDELTRAFQASNPHSTEYVERLRDEPRWLDFARRVQHYYEEQVGDACQAARVAARRILHLYYQTSAMYQRMRLLKSATEPAAEEVEGSDLETLLTELTVLVYRHGDERAKAETMLAHVYHLAIENQFFRARDLFLMTHLQESIQQQDIGLQIMYNRALAQLGLCAFRCGLIGETHACLADLCSPPQFFDPRTGTASTSMSRIRELLAQHAPPTRQAGPGTVNSNASDADRRRQVPFHMQISTELLEAVHLTSAMLLEVPLMAAVSARNADWLARIDASAHGELFNSGWNQNLPQASGLSSLQQQARQVSVSRAWQHFMRGSLRGQISGPPENTRDHIVVASKHLLQGDWRAAYEVLASAKVWAQLEPGLSDSASSQESAAGQATQAASSAETEGPPTGRHASCLSRLQPQLKEAALKAFVLAYAPYCDTFALETELAEHFELEPRRIHAILSKMIVQGELSARWDQPTGVLAVHHRHMTRLQRLSIAWAEKLTQLLENNERLVDMRSDVELATSSAADPEHTPSAAGSAGHGPRVSA